MSESRSGPPLARDQIEALVRRAFGPEAGLLGVEQFRGGTHHQVYRLTVPGRLPLILRVGPPATADLPPEERDRMRREQAMRPAFAPIAHLMPQPVFVDFSHEALDRDYMFQTFIEGSRWDEAADQLAPEAALALWREFGALLRQIHDVAGEAFGDPPPGRAFARWSEAVEYRLEGAATGLRAAGLAAEAGTLDTVLATARARRVLLDEVAVPRLLHGDLWLFNLLIRDSEAGPRLVGVLDADRAWWGDPLADWTMFVLAKLDEPELAPGVAQFWEGYGAADRSAHAALRRLFYEVVHVGTALAHAARTGDEATLARGRVDLPAAAARLAEAD